MTAVGGFVDISELVFAAKAGSTFGYALIWVSLSRRSESSFLPR